MIYTHKMRGFLRKGRGIQVLETSAGVFLKTFKIETSEKFSLQSLGENLFTSSYL